MSKISSRSKRNKSFPVQLKLSVTTRQCLKKVLRKHKNIKLLSNLKNPLSKNKKNNYNLKRRNNDDPIKSTQSKLVSSYPSTSVSTKQNSRNSSSESKKYETKFIKSINYYDSYHFLNTDERNIVKNKRSRKQNVKKVITSSFYSKLQTNLRQKSKLLSFEDKKDYDFLFNLKDIKIKKNFLQGSPKILPNFRLKLLQWISELCYEFQFQRTTFYLTIYYVDNFISKVYNFEPAKYQLLGACALSLASKLEEVRIQDLRTFVKKSNNIYDLKQLKEMEINIVKLLEYKMAVPTINSVMSFLTKKWDDYIIKNNIKFTKGGKKTQPLFYNDSNGDLFFLISQYLDLIMMDNSYVNFNCFKLVTSLIYTILFIYYNENFSQSKFKEMCDKKSKFVKNLCSIKSLLNKTFESFLDDYIFVKLKDLHKFFNFLSNFIEIKFCTEKLKEESGKMKKISDLRLIQFPISQFNKFFVEKYLEN
jgi:hypothetical protein